jgi:hypothetical protein
VLLHDSDCTAPPGAAAAALGALTRLLAECARRGLTVGPLAEHAASAPEVTPGGIQLEPRLARHG